VSEAYETAFNIQLAIVEVKIMQGCGDSRDGESLPWNKPCYDGFLISDRLSAFSEWRGKKDDQHGLWHLMTKCNSGPSVGIAWLNELCSIGSNLQKRQGIAQYVSGTGVSSVVPTEWKVIAHEIAHSINHF
jgi:hypothetical protein